jgi:predicted aspartyl protease
MMGRQTVRALLTLWLLLAAQAALACEVRQVAAVPIDISTTNLIVHAAINGTMVPLILDSGAERTVLDVATVQRLNLPRDEWVATTMRGIGGDERQRNVLPQSIVLGGAALRSRSIAPGLSLPVGHMAFGTVGGAPIGGLLGADLLASYDLMLDGPGRRLTLYDVQGCAGRFLPWHRSYEAIPTLRPVHDALMVPARIDGRVMLAQIDTGSSNTFVLAPGMARLGLTDAMLDGNPAVTTHGLGPDSLTVRVHRFRSLTIGTETIADPALWVGPAHSLRIVDMLLGADWMRPRVIWLSYATTQVFIARP